jgi:thymidylate synthase (FAD)
MEVKLLRVTHDDVELVANACRKTADVLTDSKISNEKIIKMLVENDYSSALEHIIFTFELKDISIAIARELLEHRIASHTARSTRYCKEHEAKFVTPPDLPQELRKDFENLMKQNMRSYSEFFAKVLEAGFSEAKAREWARYLLPLGTTCTYIWTINARSLINFLGLRLCVRAAPEMRELASKIHKIVKEVYPEIFSRIGCRGFNLGVCPENEARPKNCPYIGVIPTKAEVKEEWMKKCKK